MVFLDDKEFKTFREAWMNLRQIEKTKTMVDKKDTTTKNHAWIEIYNMRDVEKYGFDNTLPLYESEHFYKSKYD